MLPKVPDQSGYYSRQLYFYNFTVVQRSSKSSLLRVNVSSYCWIEDEFGKGSNEICSAVFHRLNTNIRNTTKTLRLTADACSGQNKNSTTLMLLS